MARQSDLIEKELIAKIEEYERNSYGPYDSELSDSRAEALDYYNGELFGNEVEGRSQVISRDVLDVVESALPQLLKIFVSGDEVVRFDARNPDDEEAAEQETAAVNYFALEKNDGFSILYTWFKDALLSKNGYCKVWYEENEESEVETYRGLTDDQMTMLLSDEKVEVVEHTEYIDEQQAAMIQEQAMQTGQPVPPLPMLHDVKIQVTEVRGQVKIDNVAPEDILVSYDTKTVSLQNANFVQHRVEMTEEEVLEHGWDNPKGLYDNDSEGWDEQDARNLYGEEDSTQKDGYLVKDTYIRIGGELKRYVIIGNTVVHEEDAEIIPFVCITPHIMPHRHLGMSYADLTKDIQLQKSTLLRGQFDSQYLGLQPRFAISDRVNLADMLQSRPGGVVRVQGDPGNAIMPLMTAPVPPTSFSLVEYLDSSKEKRTGVTAYNQGLDANSLNKTATGVNQIMQAAQQRLELVARTFANTGVKELFMLVHRMIRKHYTKPEIIRLRGKWVPVDPREWKERKDMSVVVGLGTGNKDQQLMHLMTILQAQREAIQIGIATPKNIYNALVKLTQNAGFKTPEEFWTDPDSVEPQPPKPDPQLQIEQMKIQADQQKFQAEAQMKQVEADKKAQLDIQKFQAQAEIDRLKAEQQMQQELARSANDVEIERQKMMLEAELEKFKAELKAQTDIQIAQINAQIEAEKSQREAVLRAQDSERQMAMHQEKIQAMTKPKTVKRDENGRVSGVE